ncbi:MAG: hypothetical protein HZA31_11980 [Opitutae bacterium]|nr:hypothetical protein [Opitutae bacterium]
MLSRLRIAAVALALLACTSLARDFTPPDAEARRAAIGRTDLLPALFRQAFAEDDDFAPIAKPERGDWLAAHKEDGQTFDQFLDSNPQRPDEARPKIYILPLGNVTTERSPSLARLQEFATAFFQLETVVLPAAEIDDKSFRPRLNPHSKRRQIYTISVLGYLSFKLPADAYCLLGVTMEDLYPAASWNYVFGQASLSERVGVYSFVRYDPEFFGEARSKTDASLILRRSCKVLAHESVHMFGLPHCIYFQCLENGSNSLPETDRKPLELCPVCLRKLRYSVGFDLVKRYRDLEKFYRSAGWEDDAAWVQRRLKKLAAAEGK